ncbi:hypothetical protein SAMN04515668_4184 [Hymenobacter arizonensis]|uniref:Uncharacterized protein n=1 Tax=Hymenobacter arizonensis TaxID=1227077 RepID=A0A1I6B5D9_HYMAR|nr:hypothetical protein SAMN04515668_4184 [Hymenobacter arizonensis]
MVSHYHHQPRCPYQKQGSVLAYNNPPNLRGVEKTVWAKKPISLLLC